MKKWIAYALSAALMLTSVTLPVHASVEKQKGAPIVDLAALLAPPPAEDSAVGMEELKEVKHYQDVRTKEQVALAQADMEKSVFRFQTVLGDKFTAENLPLTAALFDKVAKIDKDAVAPAKDTFNHPRPFVNNKDVKPCLKMENEGSYPSGHATFAATTAILLANMIPEKKAEIFKRAWEYSENRVLGGVHYRSDIVAGRISGTVIAALLMKDKKFAKEFDAAKDELRKALGY